VKSKEAEIEAAVATLRVKQEKERYGVDCQLKRLQHDIEMRRH
jgi:hypothetical protein